MRCQPLDATKTATKTATMTATSSAKCCLRSVGLSTCPLPVAAAGLRLHRPGSKVGPLERTRRTTLGAETTGMYSNGHAAI